MLQKIINRLIPMAVPVSIFFLVEEVYRNPKWLYSIAAIILVVVFVGVWQLTGRHLISQKFWRFVITPVLFSAGAILYLIFLKSELLKQLFLLGFVIMSWISLEVIFLRFNFRPKYQVHSLENIFTHLDIITIFLITSGLYSFIAFLGFDLWTMLAILTAVVLALSYQLIWTSDATIVSGAPYSLVITLTVAETFLAVSYLPTSVYVGGMMVSLSYYCIGGLSRNWLLGNREAKVVRRYLVTGAILAVLVLATAKWF
ncbi:MAG: hypothetical protein PHW95_00530 [Patescibacteria group bacterium]|nr:hypothetical protein [Patescibacteria group bacterium]